MFLQITSSNTSPIVNVFTNVYAETLAGVSQVTFNKNFVIKIERKADFIGIYILNERPFFISTEFSENALKVDEINGETPTSLEDLHNRLNAIF